MNIEEKNKLARKEGWLSIFINFVLFGIKYWAGIVSGSVALISDAWHSLTDSAGSVAVIIGAKISSKPPDKEHPFGHGRAELITAIVIGVLLVLVAVNFFAESVLKLTGENETEFGTLAIIITIASVLLKEASAQYAFYTARKTGWLSLKADGWHHRTDSISSIILLAGIFVNDYFIYTDGILGLIISGIIFYTAVKIIREASDAVLGEAPTKKSIELISQKSDEIAGRKLYAHKFHQHNYGNFTEITFHIFLPAKMTIAQARKISSEIEEIIEKELEMHATIHIDPEPDHSEAPDKPYKIE